jgi:hypothetical protein
MFWFSNIEIQKISLEFFPRFRYQKSIFPLIDVKKYNWDIFRKFKMVFFWIFRRFGKNSFSYEIFSNMQSLKISKSYQVQIELLPTFSFYNIQNGVWSSRWSPTIFSNLWVLFPFNLYFALSLFSGGKMKTGYIVLSEKTKKLFGKSFSDLRPNQVQFI